MRILSTQPLRELDPLREKSLLYQVTCRPDSLESLRTSTWFFGKTRAFYRRVLDCFRFILSRFLPIQSYTSVSPKRITYQRLVEKDRTVYRVLVDEVSTGNEIIYSKKGKEIVVSDLIFPDQAMRAHIGMLFEEILKSEGAECFSTNVFDFANLLRKCGYEANGVKIRYYPESDIPQQLQLGILINLAKKRHKEGRLPEEHSEYVERVNAELESANLVESVLGSFIDLGSPEKQLFLSDVLRLMDCSNIPKMNGVTFEYVGRDWAKFRKS